MILPELIIIEVKKYPALYKLNHPDYYNTQKKDEYLYKIADDISMTYNFKVTKEEVKSVWEKLKHMHQQSHRQYLPSGSGASELKTPQEEDLLQQLSFLNEKSAHRPIKSSVCASTLISAPPNSSKRNIWNCNNDPSSIGQPDSPHDPNENNNKRVKIYEEFNLLQDQNRSKPMCNFPRNKKPKKEDNYESKMDGLISILQEYTAGIVMKEKTKVESDEGHFKLQIFKLFKPSNTDEANDKLLFILLEIIRKYKE